MSQETPYPWHHFPDTFDLYSDELQNCSNGSQRIHRYDIQVKILPRHLLFASLYSLFIPGYGISRSHWTYRLWKAAVGLNFLTSLYSTVLHLHVGRLEIVTLWTLQIQLETRKHEVIKHSSWVLAELRPISTSSGCIPNDFAVKTKISRGLAVMARYI